jgi:DNA repair protein RadC
MRKHPSGGLCAPHLAHRHPPNRQRSFGPARLRCGAAWAMQGTAMSDEPSLFDAPPVRGTKTAARTTGADRLRETGHDPSGHRSRLRQRLLDGGDDALADHELIEYLLMTAIPQKDVKPLARVLLARFGSIAGVFNAEPHALMQVSGIKETAAAALKIAGIAARRLALTTMREESVLSSWQALIDYLHIDMAHLTHERVRVLYLNVQNRLLLDQVVSDGTLDESAIYTREIIAKAMAIGAAALILVHNHPSGSPQPSRADIQVTQKIIEAGRHLGITVHDHVIIGREGHVSLKAKGLI